jgi:antitoxin component of MazEF toxin-antitoxin module
MARYRPIKKYGNAFVIALKPQDVQDLNLKLGDMVDIEDAVNNKSLSQEVNDAFEKLKRKKK